MLLPEMMVSVLEQLFSSFTRPTRKKFQQLCAGALLIKGVRTVTRVLEAIGRGSSGDFSRYHHLFNRNRWRGLHLSKNLLHILTQHFCSTGELIFAIDETLERRWGKRIKKKSHWRDPLSSSRKQCVTTPGMKWIVIALTVQSPWSGIILSLPLLSLIHVSQKYCKEHSKKHHTVSQQAMRCVRLLRKWLPKRDITLVGDSSYSAITLCHACNRNTIRFIAPLRLDAALYKPAQKKRCTTFGRPRIKGKRLPTIKSLLTTTNGWQQGTVDWYAGETRTITYRTGTAVWYHSGMKPLPIRWVVVMGEQPKAFFSTRQDDSAEDIISRMTRRWSLETTFQETRCHLGFETQRQWSDAAIERQTPCILGMYTIVVLFAELLYSKKKIPVKQTAWYKKKVPTFSDLIAAVREDIWNKNTFSMSLQNNNNQKIYPDILKLLIKSTCYT